MQQLQFLTPDFSTALEIPLVVDSVKAGFPSPAEDFIEKTLDLNDFLIRHPSATFFVKVSGDSMINAGIYSGDMLIVDRSVHPGHNHIVVAAVDGEFTVKRLRIESKEVLLMPENPKYQPIHVSSEANAEVWGVVTHVIHTPV